MCEPSMALLAISAGTALFQHKQASDSAKAQTDAINDGMELSNNQTRATYEQNNQAAMQQQSERHKEFLVDQGRLSTILAESGMQGATQDRIQAENENQADSDMATIESNRMKANAQVGATATAQQRQAKGQLAAIKRPSALGTGLKIAGDAWAIESKYHPIKDTYHKATGTQPKAPVYNAAPRQVKR